MNDFTPWTALAGGALIGLAAALFAVANGRIAGISGLLGSLLAGRGVARKRHSCSASSPRRCCGNCLRPCRLRTLRFRPGGWWSPGCWSASAPVTLQAAPAAMVCVAFPDCRRARQ